MVFDPASGLEALPMSLPTDVFIRHSTEPDELALYPLLL
jgi:hypothetical protein